MGIKDGWDEVGPASAPLLASPIKGACARLCSTPRPGRSKSPDKLGFWAALFLLISCHFGSDRTAAAKGLGADIRESALKARELPEAPLGTDPWWEEREEPERPLRKMFGAESLRESCCRQT